MIRDLRFEIFISRPQIKKKLLFEHREKSRVEYLRYDNMKLVYSTHETSSRLFLLNFFTLHYYLLPKNTRHADPSASPLNLIIDQRMMMICPGTPRMKIIQRLKPKE